MFEQRSDRTSLRAAMRRRMREYQRGIARQLGLPKAFIQYAKRHGVDAETIRNERLKYGN